MSYESVSGLGTFAASTGGFFGGRSSAAPESLPSPRPGEVRVPQAERGPLKAWYERFEGTKSTKFKEWVRKDPTFSTCPNATLDLFRKTRRRVELVVAKEGVVCKPEFKDSSFKARIWWRGCDKVGWAMWNEGSMTPATITATCTAVPASILRYWATETNLRKGAPVPCPTQVLDGVKFYDELFGFNALAAEAKTYSPMLAHIFQFTPIKGQVPANEDEASGQAVEEAVETAKQTASIRWPLWVPSKPPPPPPPPAVSEEPQEVAPESEEAIETATTEQPRDTGKYLMWGLVAVAAGGLGYLAYRYLRKPKTPPGFKGNPEDEGFGVQLRADAPRDVKMVVKAMNRSARLHLGEADPRAVRWAVWPNGRWVVSDNFDRRKAALVKELDGSWTLHDYTARVTERLTQSQAERVAGMFFRGL